MGETSCQLTVLDVAELLQARYAFISGGKTKDGHPIITFPDTPESPEISLNDYKNLISYLVSVPSLQEADGGFAIIVDRRRDKWSSVKAILLHISAYFPGIIHIVFIMKPSGFFQRHFQEVGNKSIPEQYKFEIKMCNDLEDVYSHIDKDHLSQDLGGNIVYDHTEWIQQRAAIEKYSANTVAISITLKKLVEVLQETEMPNDVPSTESLITDHETEKNQAKEDIHSAVVHGETLLSCIRVPSSDEENQYTESLLSASKLVHVTAVERLLVQLEETEKALDNFWESHNNKLQQCLQLRKFEDAFKMIYNAMDGHLAAVSCDGDNYGETGVIVDGLINGLNAVIQESQDDIKKAVEVQTFGQTLIDEDHYAVDCIGPKCLELKLICQRYHDTAGKRSEGLNKAKELHARIDKANKWCTEGVDYLASLPLERLQTEDGIDTTLNDISTFLSRGQEIELNDPKEFKQKYDDILTPELKTSIQSVLKRVEDVQQMCQSRISSLKKMSYKSPKPVQSVSPEPIQPTKAPPTVKRDRLPKGHRNNDGRTNRSKHLSKSKIQVMRHDIEGEDSSSSYDGDVEAVPMERNGDRLRESPEKDVLSLKRGHVMKELIETERLYVAETDSILKGYHDMMDDPSMQHLIPQHLLGKKDMVFGNLRDIYYFHKKIFLCDLENCENTPALVGRCFVERKEELQMYSEYCQNKPRSEALRSEVGNNNLFFKECQRMLGHKLPLGAYLIKPVQRITKYQLLLREMLKYSANEVGSTELQGALDCMLSVVKYVNDTMHQISIKGFQGNLSEQGKLLMQGAFNVWTEHKDTKDKIKSLRFKPMQRHLFLYEKILIFCKKKDGKSESHHQDKASYIYKTSLKMAHIGLTETFKNDKRKFEVWLHGRSEVFIIQAPTDGVKNYWVKEIKKVLLNQFDEIKENGPVIKKAMDLESPTTLSNRFSISSCGSSSPLMSPSGYKSEQNFLNPVDDVLGEVDDGWSTDEFSNTEDEGLEEESNLHRYTAIADYEGEDGGEISLAEDDKVEVVTRGNAGWWYVRSLSTADEGWAPASYLEHTNRQSSRSNVSMSSQGSAEGIATSSHTESQV